MTTDRHVQIRHYMRKERPDILHQFDIWHVSKSIKKKLSEKAKRKLYMEIKPWIKSIINHFWWCCATCNGDETILKEKWLSILCHIKNEHSWDNAEIFKCCEHGPLSKGDQKSRKWLREGTPSYKALTDIVNNKHLLADLKYLIKFNHTDELEVYHSLYNKYCPKRQHFSYAGMVARSQLAILDHNSGAQSLQATTKKGDLQYKQSFSRVSGCWVVKKISEKKEKSYISDLFRETIYFKTHKEICNAHAPDVDIPQNIAPIEKPNKKESIKKIRTRFEARKKI